MWFYGNFILSNGGKAVTSPPGSEERAQLAALMDELCDEVRILVDSLSVETIKSWRNKRDVSATIKALLPSLKLYHISP
ncbi:MAG: hypothetical protein FD169_2326 [Bacillota bacterium]|nr:MAG: hypothetical protein FD169_2326 [Bacillota bacterium]